MVPGGFTWIACYQLFVLIENGLAAGIGRAPIGAPERSENHDIKDMTLASCISRSDHHPLAYYSLFIQGYCTQPYLPRILMAKMVNSRVVSANTVDRNMSTQPPLAEMSNVSIISVGRKLTFGNTVVIG